MRKKLMVLILLAALVVALPVFEVSAAEGSMDNFVEVLPYEGQFTDVPADTWYAPVVTKAYSYGLIQGVSESAFAPDGNLTVAEAVTMADRVHSIYYTGEQNFAPTDPWYDVYIDYALENGILSEVPTDCDEAVTRARFASILARALPEEELPVISMVEDRAVPDVALDNPYYADIYLLYRAGVLTGNDDYGSALPDNTIIRAEASAVLTRLADPGERRSITLTATVTMYADDGRTILIYANDVATYEALGWYRYPVTRVYSVTNGSIVIPVEEKDAYLKAGWYAEPIVPLPSNITNRTQALPIIYINTNGKSISRTDTYTSCTVSVYNVGGEQALSGETGGIRVRGNASRSASPPPYRIKFDSKQNLLGLNDGAKMKSWVLLTTSTNMAAGIRMDVAFRLGRMLLEPDGYYCSDSTFVHVYLNGKFHGVYLLAEQNQVNKNRVNVTEPEEGYTGTDIGYLVELDNYGEKPYFIMDYEKATVKDINGRSGKFRSYTYSVKSDTYDQSQVDFIANYFRGVFKIIYQACEKGNYLTFDENWNVVESSYQSAQETVEAVIDVRSFVDMYILYEIMHDFDVGGGSFFFCVDFAADSKFTKLTCNAPWDFDWTCMGNTDAWFAGTWNIPSQQLGDRSNPWFIILCKQSWFQAMAREKWAEVGGAAAMNACLDEELAIINANTTDLNRSYSSSVSSGRGSLNWLRNRVTGLNKKWA